MEVRLDRGRSRQDDAARLWAAATGAREGLPEAEWYGPRLDRAVAQLADVADDDDGGVLVVAVDGDGDDAPTLGFAAVEPAADGTVGLATVRFVAVDPGAWSRGVAALLLDDLAVRLVESGYHSAELLVRPGNGRARDVYARHGWRPEGAPFVRPGDDRPMQRYVVHLTGSA